MGHVDRNGGGARNQFGINFAAADHTWSKTLCTSDSDGDGVTDGVELGDPCCKWTVGATPQVTTDISHPGLATSKTSRSCSSYTCDNGVSPCVVATPNATAAGESVFPFIATLLSVGIVAVIVSQLAL